MARWTREQVEKLAPDASSVAAARKLARPGPWSDTGATDTLLWGKCQGSGRTPYQVSVDLTGPAAKCTCPSRKFPCKHGLALLLLWVAGDGDLGRATSSEAAQAASDWAAGRAKRSTRATAAASGAAGAEPADPEAQARRREQRLATMTAGAAELETWLGDLYRQGLAAARQQPYAFWDTAAARLVDAQLPGLAARVRDLPGRLAGRDDWADVALAETGRWFAAARAWARRDALAPDDLGNLRAILGWAAPADEIRAGAADEGRLLHDTWLVEGAHRTDDGRLQTRRTWIRGLATGERLMVLDFAAGAEVLAVPRVVGSVVTGPVVVWPGSGVRRAQIAGDTPARPVGPAGVDGGAGADPGGPAGSASASGVPGADGSGDRLAGAGSWAAVLDGASARLAANPFADQVPVAVRATVVADGDGGAARVVDGEGWHLPLAADVDPWPVMARVGPEPVPLFAELEDGAVRPLAAELGGELVAL